MSLHITWSQARAVLDHNRSFEHTSHLFDAPLHTVAVNFATSAQTPPMAELCSAVILKIAAATLSMIVLQAAMLM